MLVVLGGDGYLVEMMARKLGFVVMSERLYFAAVIAWCMRREKERSVLVGDRD